MKLRYLLHEFNYYLHIEKNYSLKTIKTYGENILVFIKYLETIEGFNNPDLESVTNETLKRYLMHIKSAGGNKPSTINLKLSSLKSFYSFMKEKGYIEIGQNIMTNIKQQKLPKTLPVYMTADEAEYFLLGIKLLSPNAVRDYAIFTTFLMTAGRLSEIVNLRINDIDFKNHKITFYGKGAKERTIPLVDRVEEALKEYLNNEKVYVKKVSKKFRERTVEDKAQRGRIPSIDTNIVFLSKYGRPFTERGIQDLFKRLAEKIGIYRKGLSVHKLRHTCITLLYREGVDVLKLKAIAGHENIRTTEVYTHLNNDDLYLYMKKHPLNHKNYDNNLIQRLKDSIARSV